MGKSYRFKTTPGKDKNLRLNIEQDFDFLEILSLRLAQEDVYPRFCADYGVVAGRVIVNGGYGVPNASVSIFVPLSSVDENDPVISTLYPYKNTDTKNEDGYRYNLLPYRKEYQGHTPTGTFPDREDLLTRSEVLEVYEKYYKYTVRTNESGDFMIVGVPLGNQRIVMDLDLSNIGCFSLRPSDLIRMGMGTDSQFAGSQFRSSTDLSALPQIINIVKDIEVASFWGEEDLCDVGITRIDFDLRDEGIEIKPHCVFMGSMFSTDEKDTLLTNCKPKFNTGNLCDLVSAPGRILAIRQTINYDSSGYPILEQYNLPEGGRVIDNEGTWLVELPMNMDYITTNEFGEQVFSNDPTVGIPTKAKYRFRIEYQNEGGDTEDTLRADYLVPNIREYGWNSNSSATGPNSDLRQQQSYAFSLDWNDYGSTGTTEGQFMIQEAINCNDKFFEFNFNRVYTISSFIDRWKWGYNRSRHLGIKEITDRTCTTTTNTMPVNDGVRNFDFLFFVVNFLLKVVGFFAYPIIPLLHLAALTWPIFKIVLAILIPVILGYLSVYFVIGGVVAFPAIALGIFMIGLGVAFGFATFNYIVKVSPLLLASNEFRRITLPSLSYPDCEGCACDSGVLDLDFGNENSDGSLTTTTIRGRTIYTRSNSSYLINSNSNSLWSSVPNESICDVNDDGEVKCGNNDSEETGKFFCELVKDGFQGSNQLQESKYQLNSWGIRYALAGYPNTKVKGTPINRLFYPKGSFILQRHLNLSHRLNWINLRQRYFDKRTDVYSVVHQNKITTTVKNGNTISQPFTDNVLILVCDPDTVDKLPAGTILSFTNPDNINDPNTKGFNLSGNTENQFGTNSITGTSVLNLTTTVNYIKDDATLGTSQLYLTGSTTGRTYNYKGGIEYFQVLTGFTFNDLETINPPSGQNYNILRYGMLNAGQRVYYRTSCGQEPVVASNINSLKIMGESYKTHSVIFLVRGVDVFTEKQNIEYDLSKLFGYPNGTKVISGQYYLNIPIQPNSGNANDAWWINGKTPESHLVDYNNPNQKLYHKPFNFKPDQQLYSAFTTNTIKYYSSLDRSQFYFNSFNGDSTYTRLDYYTDIKAIGDNTINNHYDTGLTDVRNNAMNMFRFAYIQNNLTLYDNTPQGAGNISNYDFRQGNVEGGSFMAFSFWGDNSDPYKRYDLGSESDLDNELNGDDLVGNNNQKRLPRLYSPAYYKDSPNLLTNITYSNQINNAKLIVRSDRLPTSDTVQSEGNNGYCLFQNDNFTMYIVNQNGDVEQLTTLVEDQTGNANDFADDGITGATSVISTFSCEGMVPLRCYQGNGENFTVLNPCPENEAPVLVKNGCYRLVQKPYFRQGGLARDYALFQEWKTRYRFTYAACRGVISHVFQNNWLNGSLYAFSFKRKKIFNTTNSNNVSYNFCGSKTGNGITNRLANQGTIYWDDVKDSFFYRSTPYVITVNNGVATGGYFIGQKPQRKNILGNWEDANSEYKGLNKRNMFYPTTIMDLGPRDKFAKEICFNPQLDNYLAETLKSTSYNDTSDLLLFFMISRLVSTKTWGKVLNSGDSSIAELFSRGEGRLDGDLAQLFSINSEYGVIPFDEQNYGDDDIVLDNPANPNNSLIGVLFSSVTENRIALTPGIKTFENNITQLIGYPKTQEVPMYKWALYSNETTEGLTGSIFGTEYNTWKTDLQTINGVSRLYSVPYQSMSYTNTDYFKAINGPKTGYIMNDLPNGDRTSQWLAGTNAGKTNFVVGAPYHFYFGLGKGKTALNRYIQKYVLGVEI
jgi:hypothetical protein